MQLNGLMDLGSEKWKLYKYRVGKKMVVWEEDIERTCVVHKQVALTKDNRLDSRTKKELKTLYA